MLGKAAIGGLATRAAGVDDRHRKFESGRANSCRKPALSSRDRDFRPNRRRGFDDDSYEQPTRNFGYAPPRGPQFVKWYNPDKGFGFVTLDDGSPDAFLHARVVERHGASSVPPGATLEVRTGPGQKGPQVTEILGVDMSTALQEPPRRARPGYPSADRTDRPTIEEVGTVKWYNATKGFGFIGPDQGGKDIFVHASALVRSAITGLAEGQRIAADVAEGQKGPEAVRLRLI
jgi:CspA family cold shock protein